MSNQRSTAKPEIEKLVRFFEKNIYQFKSASFNEMQARQQLIDPFFEALGWDVHNRKMNPIYLQEVIPEGRVKTNIGKEVKEQQTLFEKDGTLGKRQREYASILDFIAEDNYKASRKEAIKKPDYRFRIKGQTKFFVVAKKPFVDLSKSAEAIFLLDILEPHPLIFRGGRTHEQNPQLPLFARHLYLRAELPKEPHLRNKG